MTGISNPMEGDLLVCVGPNPMATKLVSAAQRIATRLEVKWFAAYVEAPRMLMLPQAARDRAMDGLRLAEQLGAEAFTLHGRNVAEEIINVARQRNITNVIVGKPTRSLWRSILLKSPVDELVRTSGKIDVHVITGDEGESREAPYVIRPGKVRFADYGSGLVLFALATALCFLMIPYFHLSNLIMVYLLGVMLAATSCGRGPAILVSLISVLGFDFFFVPPRWTFTVEESQYIVTFIVMFLVALVISHLATMLRQQAQVARLQERQAAAMHGLSRQLASIRGTKRILDVAVRYLSDIFECKVTALFPDVNGKLSAAAGDIASVLEKDIAKEIAVARLAYDSGRMAGWGIQDSPMTNILYVPLQAVHSTLGVLALRPAEPERFHVREQLALLESLANQVALALEVERLAGQPAFEKDIKNGNETG